MPSEGDLRLAYQAGPAGAALASRWLDAVVAGLPDKPTHEMLGGPYEPASPTVPPASRPLRSTATERYGWRFWALRPDDCLVSPFAGAVCGGATFDADCDCGSPAGPECGCGVHYTLDAAASSRYADLSMRYSAGEYPVLQRLRDDEWPLVLTYGVAVGPVEIDRDELAKVVAPGRRARRWHILALMSGRLDDPVRRAHLARRYGCEVIPETSVDACRAVSDRLMSSVSPARMAELAA